MNYYKDKKILLSSLEQLKEIEKKYHIDFYIYLISLNKLDINDEIKIGNKNGILGEFTKFFPYLYNKGFYYICYLLQNFLSSKFYQENLRADEKETILRITKQKSLSSAFSLAKDGFANQNRKVESILSPIINSGQVI